MEVSQYSQLTEEEEEVFITANKISGVKFILLHMQSSLISNGPDQ